MRTRKWCLLAIFLSKKAILADKKPKIGKEKGATCAFSGK